MMDTLPDALLQWIEGVTTNHQLREILHGALLRFRNRYACVVMDIENQVSLLRLYRSAAVLQENGTVRSTELFRVPDMDSFYASANERRIVISTTSWDDRGNLFSPVLPARRLREAPSSIDYTGAACVATVPNQIRQLEYFLNGDLRHREDLAEMILATIPYLGNMQPPPGVPLPHRSIKSPYREDLMMVFEELVAQESFQALNDFRERLHNGRLTSLQKANINTVSAYNWLAGKTPHGYDDHMGMLRTQAVSAYPVLWPFFTDKSSNIHHAMKECQPLIPVCSRELGVSETTIKKLSSLSAEAAGINGMVDAFDVSHIVRQVDKMPHGASPKTNQGWKGYFAALRLSELLNDRTQGSQAIGERLLGKMAGRWDSIDLPSYQQAIGGLTDMVNDIHVNVLEPSAKMAGENWTRMQTVETLFGNRTLDNVVEASAWWHEHQAGIRLHLATEYPNDEAIYGGVDHWPALHEGVWSSTNGLTIVALTDSEMLVREHEAMQHCVNSYTSNCLYEGAHILSLRRNGISIATAEISQKRLLPLVKSKDELPDALVESLPPSVMQFRGVKNSVPQINAWEALWEYIAHIMTGKIKVDVDFLTTALEDRQARGNNAGKAYVGACYDTTDHKALIEAWTLYMPMMPKAIAKKGPYKFIKTPEREVVHQPSIPW